MTDSQLADLLQEIEKQNILVVGDLMIDEYVHGTVNRISPEAPVPVVDVQEEEETLGGAGNVVKNLRTLGADATVLSVVGEGKHGSNIKDQLQDYDVSLDNIFEESERVSSKKTRILADSYNQQIIRVDRETREDLQSATYDQLMERYETLLPTLDAIVLSDYGKGLLTPKFSRNILKKADRQDVPTVVDPKGDDYGKYSGAAIITPNTDETEQVTGITIEDDLSLQKAGSKLLKQHSAGAILITRGSKGMALFKTPGLSFEGFEARAREVYDVTGAGDTVASMVGLGLAISDDYPTAARLANVAAGVVVGKVGTATLTVDEIRDQLQD